MRLLAWLLLTAAALWARPLLPVDETRYLSVAWEMFSRGDALVPHLNGAPYSHKPPLLFWLIELAWTVLGVSELAARLIAPLFALANLYLAAALARRLWPERPAIAGAAPWLLLGSLWWAAYGTLTMFDMLVVAFALVGLLGLLAAQESWRGWLMFAVGVAGGALAKGPVILVFLLPPALLAPLWAQAQWRRWYGALAASLLAGAAAALAWALPAAAAGGSAYGDAILWGQTSGRVVRSFAHRREVWFYLVALPAMLLPWPLWPPLWRGAARALGRPSPATRFLAIAILPAFLSLSLVSGKQPQYLMPLMPLMALALAAAWERTGQGGRLAALPPCALIAAIGGMLLWAIAHPPAGAPDWLAAVPAWTGWAIIALALAALAINRLPALAALAVGTVIIAHLGLRMAARPYYDLAPTAAALGPIDAQGRPIAWIGEYHGQLNFLARLRRPVAELAPEQALDWAAAHRDGVLLQIGRGAPAQGRSPELVQPYRGSTLELWEAAALATGG